MKHPQDRNWKLLYEILTGGLELRSAQFSQKDVLYRKRVLLACYLAIFACTGLAIAQTNGPSNLTGDWALQASGDKLLVGTMHLTQVGDTVIGSAETARGGVGQISGKLEDGKVSGKWRDPKGETGWITLNFDSALKSFNGEWGYGGRSPNGAIVAKKFRSTDF